MTRDDKLNGLERYERFLDAQRFESKEPAAPMTRDKTTNPEGKTAYDMMREMEGGPPKTTNPGAPMSDERLAEIRDFQKPMWMFCEARGMSDTVSELLDHIDALRAELTAARTVGLENYNRACRERDEARAHAVAADEDAVSYRDRAETAEAAHKLALVERDEARNWDGAAKALETARAQRDSARADALEEAASYVGRVLDYGAESIMQGIRDLALKPVQGEQ